VVFITLNWGFRTGLLWSKRHCCFRLLLLLNYMRCLYILLMDIVQIPTDSFWFSFSKCCDTFFNWRDPCFTSLFFESVALFHFQVQWCILHLSYFFFLSLHSPLKIELICYLNYTAKARKLELLREFRAWNFNLYFGLFLSFFP